MGNYTPDEYSELGERLVEAQQANARLRDKVKELQGIIDAERNIDEVATLAREAIARANLPEGLVDELAALDLANQVIDPVIRQAADKIVEARKDEARNDALNLTKDPNWVDKTREEINDRLEDDGTYAEINREVLAEARASIEIELRGEAGQKAAKHWQSEDGLAEIGAEAELSADELAEINREERARALVSLKDQAKRSGQQEISQSVEAELAAGLPLAIAEWKTSPEGVRYAEQANERQRARMKKEAEVQGRKTIDDQASEVARITSKYLGFFETSGCPLDDMETGLIVELDLGQPIEAEKTINEEYKNYDGYRRIREKIIKYPSVSPSSARKIVLISRGGGLFHVKYDSLATSDNVYARDNSLEGHIVRPGRRLKSNGAESFDGKISRGEVLHVQDDHKGKEALTDCLLPLANIKISGVDAVDGFEYPKDK